MNLIRPFPLEKSLRLFILVTTLELSVMGMFLVRARSLTGDTGYTLPRLILLLAWLIGLVICVWALASAYKRSWLFQQTLGRVENLSGSENQVVQV